MSPSRTATAALRAFRPSSTNRELRLVQAARFASVTGRWAYSITLAVYAYREAGASGVALAGIVRLGPAAVSALFAGALMRSVRLDVLLAVGGLLRTATLVGAGVAVLSGAAPAVVYVAAAIEAAISTVMRPFQNSLLPALSRTPEELTATNLTLSVIESGGVFLGPLIGAALLHGTSVGFVFLASAGAYLVSMLLLLPVRARIEAAAAPTRTDGLLAETAAGARAVFQDRDARVVVLLYGAQNLVAGALNVLIVVTALNLLRMGQSGVGTLTAAVGIGGIIGGGVVFARVRRRRHGADLGFGLLLWGVPLIGLALVSSPGVALVLLGFLGIGVTVVDVAAITLLQRSASSDLLPHALGLLQAVFVSSVAIGTLLAPVMISLLGARGALVVTGAFLPLLALGLWRRLRELDEGAAADPALVALLVATPIFAPLSQLALETLANELYPVAAGGGAVVFAQGDEGDGFYLVETGQVEVLVDDTRVRVLGPGDYFGEIALLRTVPRTATIRVLEDVRLQRLDRGPFLAMVTGNADSTNAANVVVGTRLGPGRALASA